MEDVIACLHPASDYPVEELKATTMSENSSRLIPQEGSRQTRGDRESTVPPKFSDQSGHSCGPGLRLTFSNPPKAGARYLLGRNADLCDVVLPHVEGPSREHCFFEFNEKRQLTIGNLSKLGSTIKIGDAINTIYDTTTTWIIGGPNTLNELHDDPVELWFDDRLKFRVFVRQVGLASQQVDDYCSRVDALTDIGKPRAAMPIATLTLQSYDSTAVPTSIPATASHDPQIRRRILGAGAQARMILMERLYTGEYYACKEFFSRTPPRIWENELNIMKTLEHVSVNGVLLFCSPPSHSSPSLLHPTRRDSPNLHK